MSVPVTAFYSSLLAAFFLFLSIMVIKQRWGSKVSLGDGGDRHMMQMMRVHGNFIEYVPLALFLMLMAEMNGVNELVLHVCGWWLLIARGLHAYGIRHHYGTSWQRFCGVLSTFLIYIVLIVVNLLPSFGLM